MLEQLVPDATDRGETYVLGLANYVTAVLYNGLGRFDLAQAAARRVEEHDGFSFRGWALAELVEAAVRTGDLAEAVAARDALAVRTSRSGSEWAARHPASLRRAARRGRRGRGCTTSRRSSGSSAAASPCTTRALTCCTASGYVGGVGASMLAPTSARPTRCARPWGWTPSRRALIES